MFFSLTTPHLSRVSDKRDLSLCSFSFRLQKENEPKEMRFAAVQIPAKIGWFSLNGEKLDELHFIALIFGQFAVLHARTARFLHAGIYKAACKPNPHGLSLCC